MERRIKGVLSPKASGSITITENGNYDVVDVANAVVEVPQPTGSITINANGEHNVKEYANAVVDVRPSGTIEITENGEHDVSDYATANVQTKNGLKALLDVTKTCENTFGDITTLTSVDEIFSFSDTESVTNMNRMFYNCSNLTSIPPINTENVTTMGNMFYNCSNLTSIPPLSTKNVTNMNYMFYKCSKLTTISLVSTENVTTMADTFEYCSELTTISPLDTSKVTNFNSTFYSCSKLKKIDISHYNISNESNSKYFTYSAGSLDVLIIRSFGENYVASTSTFSHKLISGSGYIYVPRAMVNTLKNATNWNQCRFRVLEDYTIDGTTTGELDESKI